MSAPENPLAFPSMREVAMVGGGKHRDDIPGMTLRDWFAGQALAGFMANANMPFAPDYAECEPAQIADASYWIADAMLAERAKGGDA